MMFRECERMETKKKIRTSGFTDDSVQFPYRFANRDLRSRNSGKSANLAAAKIRVDTASMASSGQSLFIKTNKELMKRGR